MGAAAKLRIGIMILSATPSYTHVSAAPRGDDLKQVGDWIIDVDPRFGSCLAEARYPNGERLVFTYNHRSRALKIGFTDKYSKSFTPQSWRNMDFYLFRGDDLKYFANRRFTSLESIDGNHLIISGNMRPGFFIDLLGKESVSFWYKEKPVTSFEMNHLDYTMTQLRKCAVRAARLPTVDPFAR